MNREQLEEIRARASKATEGPWHLAGRSIQADVPLSDDGPSTTKWNTTVVCSVGAWNSGRPTDEDAEFIAHARTDVPALLDEIDRLNAVAWKLRTVMVQQHEAGSHFLWIDDCPACVEARDECDGDYSCDQQKAWQKEYEEALSLPLAAPSTAEGGTSKGPEVS